MVRLLIILAAAGTLLIAAAESKFDGSVTVVWDYPTNELQDTSFHVYHSTNIAVPLPLWERLTNVVSTNRVAVRIRPGPNFFAVTASNFWGESPFSNVASTPPLPRSDVNLQVQRAKE